MARPSPRPRPMIAAALPNEIWLSVFDQLDSPGDLASVVRTSPRFKSLATRILYSNIIWSDPLQFVKNHPFMLQNPFLHTVARSLTLGISTATPLFYHIEQISRARAIVHLSGDVTAVQRPARPHETRILDEIRIANPIDMLASDIVTDAMYNHVHSFANLRELTFDNMVLPDSFYNLVHRFPALDKLVIKNCTPPLRPHPTTLHPRDLPITQLTILGLRGRRDPGELRAFGEGQHLRVIRFDWTCYIFKHFAPPAVPNNDWVPGFVVLLPPGANNPQALPPPDVPQPPQTFPSHHDPLPSPHIHTLDVKFPTQKCWQSFISEPHDQLINPFADFLVKCPRLTNLRIKNYLPWLRLPDNALPDLTSYQGPLTTIKSVVSGSRRPKHLTIRDPSGGLPALGKAFKEIDIGGAGLELETLSIFIGWWDDEILYAVLHHFSALKRLEIVYKEGDPSEDIVLGMGAHFFGKMPYLWSVRVFKNMPPCVDNLGNTGENVGGCRYPQHSIELTLGDDFSDIEGPERAEVDDPRLEEFKLDTLPASAFTGLAKSPEEPEEIALKELINAWNRYCPGLREVQLKAGYVWKRAGPDDVWTQRGTDVSRLGNAGFEEAS